MNADFHDTIANDVEQIACRDLHVPARNAVGDRYETGREQWSLGAEQFEIEISNRA
ncbi:MAG: hypothetical protein ABJN42_30605 [Roseibium sp.]|uniref:hypothetical protein n=1 Tax=Roseibium sp. TaxID=1936156 RepID=UPI00329A40A7